MNKTEQFKRAVQNLLKYADADYMANPDNWCVVHATKYMPLKHKDGTLYIPSTAMATNFEAPRTTVHTTFNHIVKGHLMGSWDDVPIVVLIPYNSLVKENGNPAQISTVDTYWSVSPERGLVLPENNYIIRPSNDVLFELGEHGATYKRDNYTEEEIKTILDMLEPEDRIQFEKYQNGEFEPYEIEREFYYDKRVKKMYESTKDKKAFLKGLFEESRFDILSHYLRDTVVRMAMEKMGFHKLQYVSDGSECNVAVETTALNMGIEATAANKGHSGSIYAEMEDCWTRIICKLDDIKKITDLQKLNEYFLSNYENDIVQECIKNLIKNKPFDFKTFYEKFFVECCKGRLLAVNLDIKMLKDDLLLFGKTDPLDTEQIKHMKEKRKKETEERLQRTQEYAKRLSEIKTIADYDENLSKVCYKNADILSKQYEIWRAKIIQHPGYNKFIEPFKMLNNIDLNKIAKTRN